MTKKHTKSALFTSVMALILCCAMLVGTTFAWFTDNVSSGMNKIQSGNLDIGVYYALPADVVDGDVPADAWKPVTAEKSLFNQDALWEPGYTEVVFFKFVNEGNLALQYQLKVDILNEVFGKTKDGADIQLSNYIQAYACNSFSWDYKDYLFTDRDSAINPDGAPDPYYDTLYNAANGDVATPNGDNPLSLDSWQWLKPTTADAEGEITYATLVLWMPTEVGNEANHDGENVPSIDLGISVYATQYTYEKDSFDDQYDKDAEFDMPLAVDYRVKSADELATVAANATDVNGNDGIINIYLADGEYNVANCGGKTLTISGSKNAVIKPMNEGESGCDYGFDGSTITFNGVTIDTSANTGNYKGFARMTATFNDCQILGSYALFGNSTFNDCTFTVSGDAYNIWTWGAPNATFNNCTFNSDGKAVLLYGTVNTKLTINNCVFNDNGGLTDLKAAIEIGNDYDKSYTLIVNNTTVNGYEINDKGINTGTTLWGNKNSMPQDKLNVVVDGVDVY